MSDDAAADARLLARAVALKHLDRAGWHRAGVPRPESVAAHSYGVALAALVTAKPEHDLGRLLAMALLHDLAEVEVGDLTPYDGVSAEEKHAREARALDDLLVAHPSLRALVDALEAGRCPESRHVKSLDKADMVLTADHYAAAGHDVREFVESGRAGYEQVFGARPKD